MSASDTIYAVSSGSLPSGVAVVRVSGPRAIEVAERLTRTTLKSRVFIYCGLKSLENSEILDMALSVIFPGQKSFTGEDCAEFHLHGGIAVVSRVLVELAKFNDLRLADAGEFSRRAFENGKLDLTEAEGLADLIAAETESQRRIALDQASGGLREKLDSWREVIVKARAFIEAEFDFSDEEDVPDSMISEVNEIVTRLGVEIDNLLKTAEAGEIIRNGYKVAIMGPPNAGKSSLLNALAKRDVAIVSEIPGTTRDVIEVRLDIRGVPVLVRDTAGLRDSSNEIELEGIDRARLAARDSDLILWLVPIGTEAEVPDFESGDVQCVHSKSDLELDNSYNEKGLRISTIRQEGLRDLLLFLEDKVGAYSGLGSDLVLNRERHRLELSKCVKLLEDFREMSQTDLTLAAENLRQAGDCLGRLTGRIDVEDLLDVVFSEFCIGK